MLIDLLSSIITPKTYYISVCGLELPQSEHDLDSLGQNKEEIKNKADDSAKETTKANEKETNPVLILRKDVEKQIQMMSDLQNETEYFNNTIPDELQEVMRLNQENLCSVLNSEFMKLFKNKNTPLPHLTLLNFSFFFNDVRREEPLGNYTSDQRSNRKSDDITEWNFDDTILDVHNKRILFQHYYFIHPESNKTSELTAAFRIVVNGFSKFPDLISEGVYLEEGELAKFIEFQRKANVSAQMI